MIGQNILFKLYFENNQILSKMVSRAENVAKEKHKKQFRKFDNNPYFYHPKRVAEIISKYKKSKYLPHLISAAYLHDILEDTDLSTKHLKSLFGDLVTSIVKELTSDQKKINQFGKQKYLADKMINMSSWALVIKLADRLDNLSDLNKASNDFKKKYIKETFYILKELENKRVLTNTQKKIIKEIYNSLYKILKPL